ncbi:MAG: hypothetical protein AABZ39_13730 [Spirochaetota bacterium]
MKATLLLLAAVLVLHAKEFATYGTNRSPVVVFSVQNRSAYKNMGRTVQDVMVDRLARSGRFLTVTGAARPVGSLQSGSTATNDDVFYLVPELAQVNYRVLVEEKKEEKDDIDTNGTKRVTTYRETEYRGEASIRVSIYDSARTTVYSDFISKRASYYRIDNQRSWLYDKNGMLIGEESRSIANEIVQMLLDAALDSAKILIAGTGKGIDPEEELPMRAVTDAATAAVHAMLSSMKMKGSVIAVAGDRISIDLGRSTGLSSRVNIAVRSGNSETVYQAFTPGPMTTDASYVRGPTNGIRIGATLEVIEPVFRPDAMFASLFVPGLGHLANGFVSEGIFFMLAESALIGSVTYCGISVSQKVRSVPVATQYDLWKDAAGIALVVTGVMLIGIHIYSVVDAAVLADAYEPFSLRIDKNARIGYAFSPERHSIGFSVRF